MDLNAYTHILDRTQTPLHAQTLSADRIAQVLNGIARQCLLNPGVKCCRKKAISEIINCANTLTTAFCFPSVTCSICCLGSGVDMKSSHWWQRGDGKIISVAEEKFPLSEISDKHAGPQPQNNVDQST